MKKSMHMKWWGWGAESYEFSTAKRFFEKVGAGEALASLPVVVDELNFEFTGCYTSQSLIKQANRIGENVCLEAEALVSMASPPVAPMKGGTSQRRRWDRSAIPKAMRKPRATETPTRTRCSRVGVT